jgi:hypothetical protein
MTAYRYGASSRVALAATEQFTTLNSREKDWRDKVVRTRNI